MRMVFLYVSFVFLALSSDGLVNADIIEDLDEIGEEIDKEVTKLTEEMLNSSKKLVDSMEEFVWLIKCVIIQFHIARGELELLQKLLAVFLLTASVVQLPGFTLYVVDYLVFFFFVAADADAGKNYF